jgi:hypothetical protein
VDVQFYALYWGAIPGPSSIQYPQFTIMYHPSFDSLMYENLEPIARLKFNKEMEAVPVRTRDKTW